MPSHAIPFQFEIAGTLEDLVRCADSRLSSVRLSLPFITVLVHPSALESDVAAEIVTHSGDRRVLSARECCDNCIAEALRSLQELRAQLESIRRVELATVRDGPLFQLIGLMLVAIKQFLTFEQRLSSRHHGLGSEANKRLRAPEDRQAYFDALELLRGHLSRCLGQIAIIAGMNMPSDGIIAGYQGAWPMKAYKCVDVAKLCM